MKSVIITLIVSLSFVFCYGQNDTTITNTLSLESVRAFKMSTETAICICIQLIPEVKGDTANFKFDQWVRDGLPYHVFLRTWIQFMHLRSNCIEVRVILFGKKTDYTFREFEQLIYLK